jgi:putative endonuclease
MPDGSAYSIYLIECSDGSLYTGIATDVERRLAEHRNSPRGARFLRGKGPLKLVFMREVGDRSLAARIEARVKRLPRSVKGDTPSLTAAIEDMRAEFASVNTG